MKRDLIQTAKRLISRIVQESSTIQANELLIIQGNTLVKLERIEAYIDEAGNVTEINPANCIAFGSHPLKASQVKNIIEQEEQNEYL